jgi:hypothetical protein
MAKFAKFARVVWLGACLCFFGGVLGVMTALNEQVGSTSVLIAALLTFVGGSLAALYRPPNLPAREREWIVQAMGLISSGLLAGLCLGFWLRYYDQAHLMTGIVRERAALDRELRKSDQSLVDYWDYSKEKTDGGGKDAPRVPPPRETVRLPNPPKQSLTLREGVEKLREKVLNELNDAIGRIDTEKGTPEEQDRMKQLKKRVQKYRDVIRQPIYTATYWLANIDLAAEAMVGLKEYSVEKSLRDLREQVVQQESS